MSCETDGEGEEQQRHRAAAPQPDISSPTRGLTAPPHLPSGFRTQQQAAAPPQAIMAPQQPQQQPVHGSAQAATVLRASARAAAQSKRRYAEMHAGGEEAPVHFMTVQATAARRMSSRAAGGGRGLGALRRLGRRPGPADSSDGDDDYYVGGVGVVGGRIQPTGGLPGCLCKQQLGMGRSQALADWMLLQALDHFAPTSLHHLSSGPTLTVCCPLRCVLR
jgi:hypothetical protein